VFLEFYKLREQPFGVTPDPRFLYFGRTHREAIASLLYAIESKRGFSALVAEPGMGKTSLLFRVLETLQEKARTAFLFQTEGDSRELLRTLLRDLGIHSAAHDPVAMHAALNESLLQELNAGRQVIVVIDEAQNLDERVLETVRLLSNFETPRQKLMHIVLAGQPGLAAKLSDPKMMQLRQRVSSVIRLEPFRDDEIPKYIDHRLRAAGHDGSPIFSADAFEIIARVSQGIPRNINSLCFQALSIGFATQSKEIGAGILGEVVSDLDFTAKTNDRLKWQEPVPWTPIAAPPPARFAEISRRVAWSRADSAPPRPSRTKWIAAAACFAFVPASIIALSSSKLGLANTLPGQISGKVVRAVLKADAPKPGIAAELPDQINPPQPQPAENSTSSASTGSSSAGQTGPASVAGGASEEASTESDRAQKTQKPNPPQNPAAVPAVKTVASVAESRSEASRSRTALSAVPLKVQVLRSETLFQFALELYGQSNWEIVEAIRAANPKVHDPFDVLSPGQWIQLPSDLVTVTANYNAYAGAGRSH